MLDLNAVIYAANDLDPLPASATRLASLVSREDTTLHQISEVVTFDPSLTGRVLRAANSAALGARTPITNVAAAVARMGLGRILTIAVGSAVQRHLRSGSRENGVEEGALWLHSVTSALAAELAGRHCGGRIPPESFTAALLHDVGKVVLLRFIGGVERDFLRRAYFEGGRNRFDAERELFDCDHAELGALMCRHWELPEPICRAVQFHHCPDQLEDPIVDAVAIGNAVARQLGHAADTDADNPAERAGAMQRLEMSAEQFERLCEQVKGNLEDVLQRY